MSQVMCVGCKKKIDGSAKSCPHCGREGAGMEGRFFDNMHKAFKSGQSNARNFYNEPEFYASVWQLWWVAAAAISLAAFLAVFLVVWLGFSASIGTSIFLSVAVTVAVFSFLCLSEWDIIRCPTCKAIDIALRRGSGQPTWEPFYDPNFWCGKCSQPFRGGHDYHEDRELRDAEEDTQD